MKFTSLARLHDIHISHEKILLWTIKGLLFLTVLTTFVVSKSFFFPTLHPQTIYFRVLVEIAFVLYIFLLFQSRRYLPKLSPLLISMTLFIAILGITSLLGIHPEKSFWSTIRRFEGYLGFLHYFAYFILLLSILRTKKEWLWFFGLLVTTSIPLNILAFWRPDPIFIYADDTNRLMSTFGNPIPYGTFLLVAFFLSLLLAASFSRNLWKILYFIVALWNLVFLFLSANRGAWVGAAVGLSFLAITFFLFFRRYLFLRQRLVILGGICIVFTAFLAMILGFHFQILEQHIAWERYQQFTQSAISFQEERIGVWQVALRAWKESPLIGYGLES